MSDVFLSLFHLSCPWTGAPDSAKWLTGELQALPWL